MIPVRYTEQVLCEVIGVAHSRLFIVSFVAYNVPAIIRALQDAAGRQVQINILLELPIGQGGRVTVDSFKMVKELIPSANLYIWQAESSSTGIRAEGAVHAKCAVADGKTAFISSANLSEAAMERNMELGVLVKNGHLPDELHKHLDALVATGIVKRI